MTLRYLIGMVLNEPPYLLHTHTHTHINQIKSQHPLPLPHLLIILYSSIPTLHITNMSVTTYCEECRATPNQQTKYMYLVREHDLYDPF